MRLDLLVRRKEVNVGGSARRGWRNGHRWPCPDRGMNDLYRSVKRHTTRSKNESEKTVAANKKTM